MVQYLPQMQRQLMEKQWNKPGAAEPCATAAWKDNADRMLFWGDDPQVHVTPALIKIRRPDVDKT
jgi:hypothetical protein